MPDVDEDVDELEGLRLFKKHYRLVSAPSMRQCIHRIKGSRRRHSAHFATFDCRPPYYDHVFGFRVRETMMPRLVLMPYFRDKQELAEIKRASQAFAAKHRVKVRFSIRESFYGPGTVLIEYRRLVPLGHAAKKRLVRRQLQRKKFAAKAEGEE